MLSEYSVRTSATEKKQDMNTTARQYYGQLRIGEHYPCRT